MSGFTKRTEDTGFILRGERIGYETIWMLSLIEHSSSDKDNVLSYHAFHHEHMLLSPSNW